MNELDRFFKDKLENRQPEFNEAHWRAAEKLLDQQQAEKRPGWLWWAVLGILLLLVSLWWGITTKTDLNKGQEMATVDQEQAMKQTRKTTEIHDDNLSATTQLEPLEPSAGENNHEQVINASNNNIAVAQDEIPNLAATKKATPPAENFDRGPQQKHVNISDTENKEDQTLPSSPSTVLDESLISISEIDLQQTDNQVNEGDFDNDVSTNLEENSTPEQPSRTAEKGTDKPSVLEILTRPEAIPNIDLALLERSAKTLQLKDPYKIKTPVLFSLGAHAMAMLNPEFKPGDSQLLGYNFGVDLRISRNSHWGLRTGLNYRIRAGHYNFADSLTEVAYSFGRLEKQYTLTPRALHFVELPVSISYRVNRHEMQFGGQVAYLAGVKGQVEVPLDGFPLRRNTEVGWIDKTGFKNIKIDLILGYHYAISTRCKAGLYLHYAPMTWVKDENILQEDGRLMIDLGLRYDLF